MNKLNTSSLPTLSVVVPLYNEEENVTLLIDRIHQALDGWAYELVLVDDFSTDNTRDLIVSKNDPKIVLVELRRNYGQSLALSAGFEVSRNELIVTIDGDLQNDPNDILKLVDSLLKQACDVVVGERVNRQDKSSKTIPSRIANFIIRRTTRLEIKDHGCALKVFRAEYAKELNLYGEMHRFITLLAFFNGARIKQIPVNHHPRKYGKSKYGLNRTFKVITDLIIVLYQQKYLQKPIYLFGNVGLGLLFTGVGINVYLVLLKFIKHVDIGQRPLLILGVLFIFVGLQLIIFGIISDLIMKTYFESQNLKPYKIRKVHGKQE